MRIAFVTIEYPPRLIGGAGIYAENLCTELARRGHEIIVFVPHTEGDPHPSTVPGVRMHEIQVGPLFPSAIQYWFKLRRAIRSENSFDIVHINSASFFFLRHKKLATCPQVMTVHHLVSDAAQSINKKVPNSMLEFVGENGPLLPCIEWSCIQCSDLIIAVSKFTRGQLASRYRLVDERLIVVPNGASDTPSVSPRVIQDKINILGLGDKKSVLFVGRLDDPRKGLDLLIDAMSRRTELASVILVAAGKGDQDTVSRLADKFGISGHLRMTGFVDNDELATLYGLCDLYVSPSRMEGFGLTLLEAARAGKRVVATRVGAIPEVAGAGTVLVPPDDPVALADAIVDGLFGVGPSPEVIKASVAHFSWKETARQTELAYRSILNASEQKDGPYFKRLGVNENILNKGDV